MGVIFLGSILFYMFNMPLYTNLFKIHNELYRMNIKEALEEAIKIAVSIIILRLITEKIVKIYTNKILIR